MLTEHAPGLWSLATPHTMIGMHLGTRMSVVRLGGGALFVSSPVALDDELKAEVDALGEVRHIVCPNFYHHVYAKPWSTAYPKALVHAPLGLRKKRRDLRIDHTLDEPPHADWKPTLIPHHIDGCMLDETVFVHPASRSIVSVDLTENFTHCDHFPTRMYLKAAGIYQRIGWSRMLRSLYRDHGAARRSIDALLEHDVDRLIVAHGDVIETGAPSAIRGTFEFLRP